MTNYKTFRASGLYRYNLCDGSDGFSKGKLNIFNICFKNDYVDLFSGNKSVYIFGIVAWFDLGFYID